MSKIKRIGAGARMSKAVVHGDTVYTAGQVADRTKGGSVKEQTREILGLIDAILAETGGDKSKILSATIYLSDIATFAEMNGVWDEWVNKANPPARATVEAKLVAPDYEVEIAVIAAA
jgi:enamine deaminase RidA (YjgF/YER057c/UK114 family)